MVYYNIFSIVGFQVLLQSNFKKKAQSREYRNTRINKDSALQPMGRIQAAGRKKCEEEGIAERMCYELTTTSHPHPVVPLGVGSEVDESGMKN